MAKTKLDNSQQLNFDAILADADQLAKKPPPKKETNSPAAAAKEAPAQKASQPRETTQKTTTVVKSAAEAPPENPLEEVSDEPENNIYTVSDITREIKTLLSGEYAHIAVEGEISNWKIASSGHAYFSIKDEGAQLNTIQFRARQNLKFEPEDGMQVVVWGRIDVYEPRGSYSLIVERMEPKGYGALQVQFEKLKAKLAEEGLFNDAHKKPIPFLPRKIAVITSPTGAAIRDFLNVSGRRFSGVEILVCPVRVQGDQAAAEIAQAIAEVNQLQSEARNQPNADSPFDDIDVIIVTRGGGSIEDLWSFNEEVVARAIFNSELPVISAVGHEVDFTIADFVADQRAPTPSAAAELSVPDQASLLRQVHDLRTRCAHGVRKMLDRASQTLKLLWRGVQDPRKRLQDQLLKVDDLRQRMETQTTRLLTQQRDRIKNYQTALGHLNPLHVLERGYSISFNSEGKAIKNATQIKAGQIIHTRLWKGQLTSQVQKVDATKEST